MDEDEGPLWLTRDSDDAGALSEIVDVWTEPPVLTPLPGGGITWLGADLTGIESRREQLSVSDARKLSPSGTIPETGRECVRLGGD